MGHTIGSAAIRKLETAFLEDGVINLQEAKDLIKAAKNEDKGVIKQMLASDKFEKAARTHFARHYGVSEGSSPNVASQKIGDATVMRTLGEPKGYDTKLQAIAAARMAGVPNAAVVWDLKDSKWHAVEVNQPVKQSGERGAVGSTISWAQGVPARDDAKVKELQGKIHTLIDNYRVDKSTDVSELNALRKQLAAQVYGVSEWDVNVIGDSDERKSGMINIHVDLGGSAHAHGKHGAEESEGEGFNPRKGTAVEIDAGALEGSYDKKSGKWVMPHPDLATTVLFHEATHQADFELAKKWVDKWDPTGEKFIAGADNPAFATWMMKQKGVPMDTKMLVINTAANANGDTEAHAYVSAFVAALQAGSPEMAKDQLLTYATGVKAQKGQRINGPSQQVFDAAMAEALKAYKELPREMKAAFKEALDAATAVNPEWPGSQVKLPK